MRLQNAHISLKFQKRAKVKYFVSLMTYLTFTFHSFIPIFAVISESRTQKEINKDIDRRIQCKHEMTYVDHAK